MFCNKLEKAEIVWLPRSPRTLAKIINEQFNNKKIVLYGGGEHSKELIEYLNNKNNIVAIIDDNPQNSMFKNCIDLNEFVKKKYF